MTSRRYGFGHGVALSLAAFCLSYTAPALAQDPVPPPSSDTTEAKPPEATPEEPKPADAPAGTPAVEAPKDEKAAAAVPPPEPLPAPSPTTASGTSVEREKAVSLVGVELLPASAYPSVQTRGIKYGSLWLTFHGQQWPYMPMIEGGPALRIGFSGSLWNDLSYTRMIPGKELLQRVSGRVKRWATETRGVLRVTPTYNMKDGWFVQGNSEFVLHGDMTLTGATSMGTTDDLYLRVGKWNLFDVQFGRFQGWEVANHFGMGLDQNTLERAGALIPGGSVTPPPDTYGLSYFWDRQDYTMGGYAAHVYPTKFLRGEFLSHIGAGTGTNSPRHVDIRPVGIFDIGYVKLKAGYEYGKSMPVDETKNERKEWNGYGFAAQFVLDPWVEAGASYARGFTEVLAETGVPQLDKSGSTWTYGGFANVSPGYTPLVLGFGAFQTHQEDMRWVVRKQDVGTNEQFQIFGAVQYTLWDRLYFKFVLSHANNRVDNAGSGHYSNNAMGGRFRVMLLF
jgi:hypothetical protein